MRGQSLTPHGGRELISCARAAETKRAMAAMQVFMLTEGDEVCYCFVVGVVLKDRVEVILEMDSTVKKKRNGGWAGGKVGN